MERSIRFVLCYGKKFIIMSKNVGHHGWPTTKNKKKKHWLKRPKAVPKNEIWTKI